MPRLLPRRVAIERSSTLIFPFQFFLRERVAMNLVALARYVKERRLALNLTLEQVATRTGLTRSVLSKVENFRVTPSLPALAKIAEALETTVSELTRGVGEPSKISIVPKGQGLRLERDQPRTGIEYELLTHNSVGSMETLLITMPTKQTRETPTNHEGEEFLYVVQGQVLLQYDDQSYELSEGDSAHFNANIPHCITNRGETPATVLATYDAGSKAGYCPTCSARLVFLVGDPKDSDGMGGYNVVE
jgi:transcriptional regulator with XRE-family HTH domain